MIKNSPCLLFEICNCKTAMCHAMPPDESCYYYTYFKKLIEEKKFEKLLNLLYNINKDEERREE